MNGVLSHDSALEGYTGLGIMPLVQDQSLNLFTSSQKHYHSITDAPTFLVQDQLHDSPNQIFMQVH